MKNRSFFGTLGTLAGSGQQENQFSRTFLACFGQSEFFRRQVLEELYALCRIRTRRYTDVQWACAVEVPTPVAGGGRMDIRIMPTGEVRTELPVFYLESKLGSPLTLEQLRRYRRHGVDYLIAVTKYSPQVSSAEAQAAGVFTLRWQDIHRRLLHAVRAGHSERFLMHSLLAYMEEIGMAYREDLTMNDLEACRRVLTIISNPRYGEYSPTNRNGFELCGACLGLLEDVWHRLVELHPTFAPYHLWSPGYFHWSDETGRQHAFGWDLWKRTWREENLAFRIWFPETKTEPLLWTTEHRGTKPVNRYSERSADRMLAKNGSVNQESLVRWLESCIKRWKLV